MTVTRRKNQFLAEPAQIHCESGVQAIASTSPVAAAGSITVDTNANMADGDTVTLDDGFRKVTYEYDKTANGVAAGNVNWAAGAGTAAQSAATLKTAINANQTAFTVTDNLNGTLTITHKWPGVGGNVTWTKSSASALAVTGMSGGTDAAMAATVAATTTQKFCKVPRIFAVDTVEWLTPTTVTQDAANYWTIALKNGSTVVASWSTLTGAQGTITGGTGVTLVNSATEANLVFAAGDTMSLVMTKTGSPSPLPPGRMTVHGHYVS